MQRFQTDGCFHFLSLGNHLEGGEGNHKREKEVKAPAEPHHKGGDGGRRKKEKNSGREEGRRKERSRVQLMGRSFRIITLS